MEDNPQTPQEQSETPINPEADIQSKIDEKYPKTITNEIVEEQLVKQCYGYTKRLCRKCKELKYTNEFYGSEPHKKTSYWCKECMKNYKRNKYKTNTKGLESVRRQSYKRLYGISIEDYERLLEAQNGLCKICGKEPGHKPLSVDHNHVTGKVRGLLCSHCNVGIGNLMDNIDIMRKAIDYIESDKQ